MLEQISDDYDWPDVFSLAGPDGGSHNESDIETLGGCSAAEFVREDVVEIVAMDAGQNDEQNWIIVGKLKDDRYFSIEAGCDYTGWD